MWQGAIDEEPTAPVVTEVTVTAERKLDGGSFGNETYRVSYTVRPGLHADVAELTRAWGTIARRHILAHLAASANARVSSQARAEIGDEEASL